ncbi:hypothetical protein CI102_9434 [Trichoderma harzianum]|nr:hypothetical protein CI102_9434 [Trichoderma harzianum]
MGTMVYALVELRGRSHYFSPMWLFWKQILVHDDIKTRLQHLQFEMRLVPSGFWLHKGTELGCSKPLEVVQIPALLMVVSIGNLFGFILIGSPQSAACSIPGKLTRSN